MEVFKVFPVFLLFLAISVAAKENKHDSINEPETKYSMENTTRAAASQENDLISSGILTKIKNLLKTYGNDVFASRMRKRLAAFETRQNNNNIRQQDKNGIKKVLTVISDNLDLLTKVKSNPNDAMKGIINIILSIEQSFAFGQSYDLGLGFFGELLELVDRGPNSKRLSAVIDEALKKMPSKSLKLNDFITKANKVTKALSSLHKFIHNGFLTETFPTKKLVSKTAITQHIDKMTELLDILKSFFDRNEDNAAKTALSICEFLAKIATWFELMLAQLIDVLDQFDFYSLDVLEDIQKKREMFRRMVNIQFEKLYIEAKDPNWKYESRILPYFDPDIHVITDFYATRVLKLGKYDRSLAAGLYCLRYFPRKDFIWTNAEKRFLLVNDKPYTTKTKSHQNSNCVWKLVPHGQNTYSIVYRNRCETSYCGAMLSYDNIRGKRLVGIDYEDPILWKIDGSSDYQLAKITTKHCDNGKWNCDRELRIVDRTVMKFSRRRKRFQKYVKAVGQLVPPVDTYPWALVKRT